jgi:hypothetical protein
LQHGQFYQDNRQHSCNDKLLKHWQDQHKPSHKGNRALRSEAKHTIILLLKKTKTMKKNYLEPRTDDYSLRTGVELMIELGNESAIEILSKRRGSQIEDYENEEELEEFLSAVEEKPLW